MKKLCAVALLMTIAIFSILFIACNSADKTTASTADSTKTNEDSVKRVIERGDYLVNHVAICLDCHSKRDETKFSLPIIPGTEGGGGSLFDPKTDQTPGILYSKNITPDVETGIGGWSDDEIIKAITLGISKNGDTLFPLMPYMNYNKMAKQDLLSIVAYLKTLKPIKNKVPERKLFLPYVSLAYPPGLKPVVDCNPPPFDNQVAYGAYLTTMGSCADCHTPMVKGQYDFSRPFAGSFTFNPPKFKVTSANITPDSTTGIGTWTEERFLNKFTLYRKEEAYSHDPGTQNTIMPLVSYAGMKDEDLKAINAFLHTVPAVKNLVEKYPK